MDSTSSTYTPRTTLQAAIVARRSNLLASSSNFRIHSGAEANLLAVLDAVEASALSRDRRRKKMLINVVLMFCVLFLGLFILILRVP